MAATSIFWDAGMHNRDDADTIDLGPDCKSDSAFVRKCRLQQSEYRALVLKEPYGVGPGPNGQPYGNMLVHGETTGSNFVSEAAFLYAKQRALDKHICPDLTLEEYRLFNNMLSSMPLCFNLFADLRALLLTDERACTAAVKALLPEVEWIDAVLHIAVEFIPTPTTDYIDDKTAFDAFILVRDARGRRGLVAVETKYTDLLGSNSAKKTDRKDDIVRRDGVFAPPLADKLLTKGYSQLVRNFLLTYTYAKRHGVPHWVNVTISPHDDRESGREIAELKQGLSRYQENLQKVDLEAFIEHGTACGVPQIEQVYRKVRARYLPT